MLYKNLFSKFTTLSGLRRLYFACGIILALVLIKPEGMSAANAHNKNFTVVIDAGHGGHDHGAIDNGAKEKDINLGVATKLAALIKKKSKNVNVVMTRDKDVFLSLQERANVANRNHGDLFISIHTNSVDKSNPNRKNISGASVYALGTHKNNDNLKVAQRENSVIELESDYHQKYSGFDPSKDESYIIFEMAQKKTIGQSLKFAEKAQKELVKSGRNDRGVRQAGFWVLWATSMPAVLVELDFICNPQAASYLNSAKGQDELANALFRAFEQYLAARNKQLATTEQPSDLPHDSRGVNTRISKNGYTPEDVSESVAIASSKDDNIGSLVSSSANRKAKSQTGPATPPSRNSNAPRRRRSQAAKEISSNRVVETEVIAQKSETDYLLKNDEPKQQEVKTAQPEDNSKNKKGKKKKDKKKKDNKKQNDKKSTSNSNGNHSAKSGKKTFIVPNNGGKVISTESSKGSSAANNSANLKRVYKILLLQSDKEVSPSDPRFHGLAPSSMYKENGMYKYTIGSSESREEIERKYLEVRSIHPEATIIVRME